jgi:hypothetical protein
MPLRRRLERPQRTQRDSSVMPRRRLGGRHTLEEFTEPKTISFDVG